MKKITVVKLFAIVVVSAITTFSCNSESKSKSAEPTTESPKNTLADKLNGSWTNTDMGFTVTIDTKAGTYKGVAIGEKFDKSVTVKSAEANYVDLDVDGASIVAQFNTDDELLLTKEGGMPITVVRIK